MRVVGSIGPVVAGTHHPSGVSRGSGRPSRTWPGHRAASDPMASGQRTHLTPSGWGRGGTRASNQELRPGTEEATMTLGVHSEVGTLRKVMVHRPGLEHTRLTPSNAEELLFDDVLWVSRAKIEHDAFCEVMRERGIEVFHAERLLAEALVKPEVRDWVG